MYATLCEFGFLSSFIKDDKMNKINEYFKECEISLQPQGVVKKFVNQNAFFLNVRYFVTYYATPKGFHSR